MIKKFADWLNEAKIKEGIRKKLGGYEFDFSDDLPEDIMPLKFRPYRGKTMKDGETTYRYYFAYVLDKSVDSTDLMVAIKNMESSISNEDINLLIKNAVLSFDNQFKTNEYDTIVSPKSSGQILTKLTEFIHDKSGAELFSDAFVKAVSTDIQLNMDKVEKLPERTKKEVLRSFVKAQNPEIPFKIKNVYSRYRKFFKDFLVFNQSNDEKLFNAVEGKKVILVDDYRTSGTTTKEMLRQLIDLGAQEVAVFNLIKLGE